MMKKSLNRLKRKLVTILSVAMVLSSCPVTTSVANAQTNNGKELLFVYDHQNSLQSIGDYTYNLKEESIDFNGFTLHDTATDEEKINISYYNYNDSIDELIRIAPSSDIHNYDNSYLQFNEINAGANTYIEFNTTEASDVTVVVSGDNKNVYLKNDENVQSETITNKSNKNSVVVFKTDAEKTYKLYADKGVRLFYLNVIPKFQTISWFLGAEDFERLFEITNEVNGTTGFINGLYIDCRNSNSINKLNNSIRFEANSVIYVPYIENKTLSVKTINNYENVKVNDNELSSNESFIINPNACNEKPGYVKIEVYKGDAYIKSIKWIESTEWSKGELFFSDLDTNKYDNNYSYLLEDCDYQTSNGFNIHDSYHPETWDSYPTTNPNSQNKIHVRTNTSPESTGVASASKATSNSCIVFNEGSSSWYSDSDSNPGDKTYIEFDTIEDSEVAVVAMGENGCKQVYLKTVDKDTNVSNVQKADIPTYNKSFKSSVVLFKAKANQTCYLYADGNGNKYKPGVCIYYVKVMPESKVESWDFTSDNFFGVLDNGENETTEIAGTTAYIDGLYIDAVEDGASFMKYNDSSDRKEKGIKLSQGTAIYVPIRDKKSIVVNASNGYSNLTVNGKALTSAKSKFIVTDEGSGRKGYIKVEAKDGEADIKNIYFNNDISVPVAVSDLTYDGTEKVGVLPGVGYKLSGTYEATNVGEYTATAKLEDGCKWDDGTTSDKEIEWSIGKALLTVTANPKTIAYGDEPANDGVSYSGFVKDENESVLDGTFKYTYDYEQNDTVGEYVITPSGLQADNYNIEYVKGTLTVAKKAITITADSATKTYDGKALTKESYTCSENGLVNGDTISKVTITGSQTVAGSSENVPSVAVIENGDGKDVTDCYDISYVKGTLTVNKTDAITEAPKNTVSVEYTCDTVSKVTLPENWSWSDADKDKALEVGTALTATAVYNGEDKANYADEAKSVSVSITRSACTHNYDTAEYIWSDDNKTCTATKTCSICNDKVTETVNSSSATISNCESEGKTTYTATFTKDGFEKQTKDVIIDATGHKYGEPTYTWSEDGKTCTATAVCANDAKHVLTEEATVTSKVTTPSTCKDMGKTTYTATFTDKKFTTQTKEVTDVAKLTTHTPKAAVKENEVAVSCEADGSYDEVVYCSVCNKELSRTPKTVKAAGHNYGEPTYTWSEDGKACTATAVCANDAKHVLTEEATVTSKVTTPSTCKDMGKTTYTAAFTNEVFTTQTKEVTDVAKQTTHTPKAAVKENEVAATCEADGSYEEVICCSVCGEELSRETKTVKAAGHDYGTPEYKWSEDGKTCTATVICKREGCTDSSEGHKVTENAVVTSKVKETATTEKMGTTTYTATFKNELFTTQTKDVEDIPKLDKPSDNPSDNPSDKPQDKTTPVETTTAPVVKEEGTTLSVAETKAEVVVTSKAGEEPTVEYKGTTDTTAKEVTVPDSVTVDGATYKVTEVAKEAFKDNKAIESVVLSENIETIGENAFDGCTSLKTVDFPNSVKEIGDSAFNGCTSLKKVTVPNSVTVIGDKAFNGCKKLTAVNVGKNVVKVGDRAFAGCTSIKKVTLPAKTNKIGKQAFKGTKKLKTLNIKSKKLTAKSISANAFKGIGKNVTIKVPKGMKKAYTALFRKKGLPKNVKIK